MPCGLVMVWHFVIKSWIGRRLGPDPVLLCGLQAEEAARRAAEEEEERKRLEEVGTAVPPTLAMHGPLPIVHVLQLILTYTNALEANTFC
jgi:hypothetical protein